MPESLETEDIADLTLAFDQGLLAVIAWATEACGAHYDAGLLAGTPVDPKRHGGLLGDDATPPADCCPGGPFAGHRAWCASDEARALREAGAS